MTRQVIFGSRVLPLLLLAPHIAIAVVFVLWPVAEIVADALIRRSGDGVWRVDPGPLAALVTDRAYLRALGLTLIFSAVVTLVSILLALFAALAISARRHGAGLYRTLIIWPLAVAPAAAAVIWGFLLDPSLGAAAREAAEATAAAGAALSDGAHMLGLGDVASAIAGAVSGLDPAAWQSIDPGARGLVTVTVASIWKQTALSFLIFLIGLRAIPRSVIEAAAIDHAGPWRRFRTITLPHLSPSILFLLTLNLVYALSESIGAIHAVVATTGGDAAELLVYRAYLAGEAGDTPGSAAAQSLVLILLVAGLVQWQVRHVRRRALA